MKKSFQMYRDRVTGQMRWYSPNGWPSDPNDGKGPNVYNPDADLFEPPNPLDAVSEFAESKPEEPSNGLGWLWILIFVGGTLACFLGLFWWNSNIVAPHCSVQASEEAKRSAGVGLSVLEAFPCLITFCFVAAWFDLLFKHTLRKKGRFAHASELFWWALCIPPAILFYLCCLTLGPIFFCHAQSTPEKWLWFIVSALPFIVGLAYRAIGEGLEKRLLHK
jgi:hypothetical protein